MYLAMNTVAHVKWVTNDFFSNLFFSTYSTGIRLGLLITSVVILSKNTFNRIKKTEKQTQNLQHMILDKRAINTYWKKKNKWCWKTEYQYIED